MKLDYFARRVYDLVGWHSELYIDAKDNPDALMFGTDLPSTRAKRHFDYGDIELIQFFEIVISFITQLILKEG